MAASMLSTQRQEDFKEQFLTCPICYEAYDKDEHQAKFLPCLHSYCKSCLQQHADRRPKINCPNCRKEVALPDGAVDSLPNNFVVENLKDYQDVFNLVVTCQSCDEGSTAVSFCYDCGYFLCTACEDDHRRLRPLRHHKISTMAEYQQDGNKTKIHQRCLKHPGKHLDLYCKEANYGMLKRKLFKSG